MVSDGHVLARAVGVADVPEWYAAVFWASMWGNEWARQENDRLLRRQCEAMTSGRGIPVTNLFSGLPVN